MHEYLAAVVTGEKAIPLVGVVPLDLAGRHAQTSRHENSMNNQRSGDRQDAMGTSKAIGPGRRIAAWYRPLPAAVGRCGATDPSGRLGLAGPAGLAWAAKANGPGKTPGRLGDSTSGED